MSKRKKKAIQQAKKAGSQSTLDLTNQLSGCLRIFGTPNGLYASNQLFIFQKFGTVFKLSPTCPRDIVWTDDLDSFFNWATKFNNESVIVSAINDIKTSDRNYIYAVCGNETLIYYAGASL